MEPETPRASDDDGRDQQAARRRGRRGRVLHAILSGLSACCERLPLSLNRAIGRALGTLAWCVDVPDRRAALRNIARAFPDWPPARRRKTVRAMFRHLGATLFEFLWLPRLDTATRERTTVTEGLDRILELIDAGRGVIVFTAHCGNWEWLAHATASFGRPVSVLQRERSEPGMNEFIEEIRRNTGIRSIGRGSASSGRELIYAIRRGGILAFVLDQNIRTESVKVPFFGVPALTPIGPAKLAIRTGAIAVVAVIERREDGKQYVRFNEPVECTPGDDPVALTARVTAEIEEQIRRVPEQWVWMHERWRERPRWDVTEKYQPPAQGSK